MNRWFLIGIGASILVTAALWVFGLYGLAVFLFLPVAFGWARLRPGAVERNLPTCPQCGRPARSSDLYCPRDGAKLTCFDAGARKVIKGRRAK